MCTTDMAYGTEGRKCALLISRTVCRWQNGTAIAHGTERNVRTESAEGVHMCSTESAEGVHMCSTERAE
eukprot:1787519-Rhodomonas_salina.1